MNTDPIADMLTRIRNATRARKSRVAIPSSKLKLRIAELLREEGFVSEVQEVKAPSGHGLIELTLRYDDSNRPVIQDLQRVSRPGLRRYVKAGKVPKVRNGLGVMIMTTSKGVMTDRSARRQGIGGEAMCAVW